MHRLYILSPQQFYFCSLCRLSMRYLPFNQTPTLTTRPSRISFPGNPFNTSRISNLSYRVLNFFKGTLYTNEFAQAVTARRFIHRFSHSIVIVVTVLVYVDVSSPACRSKVVQVEHDRSSNGRRVKRKFVYLSNEEETDQRKKSKELISLFSVYILTGLESGSCPG